MALQVSSTAGYSASRCPLHVSPGLDRKQKRHVRVVGMAWEELAQIVSIVVREDGEVGISWLCDRHPTYSDRMFNDGPDAASTALDSRLHTLRRPTAHARIFWTLRLQAFRRWSRLIIGGKYLNVCPAARVGTPEVCLNARNGLVTRSRLWEVMAIAPRFTDNRQNRGAGAPKKSKGGDSP